MYKNLSRIGICRCTKNAIMSLMPDLDPPKPPSGLAKDVGHEYFLLHARDRYEVAPVDSARVALIAYMGWEPHKIRHWARLQLPDGTVTQCAWRENIACQANVRIACDVKYESDGMTCIGEVMYYTQVCLPSNHPTAPDEIRSIAIIWRYSDPNPDLMKLSERAWWTSRHLGDESATVISVTQITHLVGMVPHFPVIPSTGFDVATFTRQGDELEADKEVVEE
ncbi:hypothetical protein CONPUDRAFT_77043 [Coniophora puteana RWD-64-598 SS2]|uniref:Uncharacterized protein n=1 Tax=Coniophora puteana (strain RWD-64-598) TaxID=741705 RepID=A0A5M3MAM4_CONPW|nr:uncharacterized protein CONPUDRAFT_77043 [Coniophora puteana RWD-64-598 SS2]EIW76026.1 hypothetical protein CONPUDRAFT_77043 [Coniophora puteana RWD-64-598 SS2]